MKKLLLPVLLSSIFGAAHSQTKLLHVVVPCNAGCSVYNSRHVLGQYIEKRGDAKVILTPRGHGSVRYMLERKLPLLMTTHDLAANDLMNEVQPISELHRHEMIMVAHKDLGLTDAKSVAAYEKSNPGKLSWFQAGNVQKAMIDTFADEHEIASVNIARIPYKDVKFVNDLARNDVNIGFAPRSVIEPIKDKLTVIKLDKDTKEELDQQQPILAMYLPKDASADDINYWSDVVKGFLTDSESISALRSQYKIPGTFSINAVKYHLATFNK